MSERDLNFCNVVSTIKAEKMMGKGYEAYLAYVINSANKELRVQEIRTIKNFFDVFSEELPGLSLYCEVECDFALILGTASVFIVPYCMTPKELKELNNRLLELLD